MTNPITKYKRRKISGQTYLETLKRLRNFIVCEGVPFSTLKIKMLWVHVPKLVFYLFLKHANCVGFRLGIFLKQNKLIFKNQMSSFKNIFWQVEEGVRIQRSKADILLNSKSEWHGPATVSLVVEAGGWVNNFKTSRKKK